MSDAVRHADDAYAMFGAAYQSAGANLFHKQLADGLGQLASAISDLAERQKRIELIVSNLR
ncbi:hypothetical protein [Mycobacterium sp. NAZ190054]|uniref:hypothetical protein n=1 Tax=Mycobacterium sp. NAZ190054 TaxID=1747766 RepID=UPI0012E36294|nr:hypothetical protein [Mycobacterium sp. NAZ190054]